MNVRNVLLWLHIVVAFVTLGPRILLDVVVPGVVRKGDLGALRFIHSLEKLGPLTMLIPLLGLALVGEGGYELKDGWIIGSLVLYALMVANGMGVLARAEKSAIERLETSGGAPAEVVRLRVFGALNIAMFLAILWLMVAKPGT